eukprot:m.59872 g.59872  ORF g.59872 m.59872 type:complete len:532 (+) comp11788_c0_seq2:333-1928(+)
MEGDERIASTRFGEANDRGGSRGDSCGSRGADKLTVLEERLINDPLLTVEMEGDVQEEAQEAQDGSDETHLQLLLEEEDRPRSPFKRLDLQVVESSDEQKGLLWFAMQVVPSLLLSGAGMMGAGALLDVVQHWPLFTNVTEMFMLCPALLGLKGNLEMVLASRLSTAANTGQLSRNTFKVIVTNLMMVQVQAILVSVAASVFSVLMGAIFHREFSILDTLLITAASTLTASLASGLLGVLMSVIVLASGRLNIDPDNVATPIAAALGDLVTLAILSGLGSAIYAIRSPMLMGSVSGLIVLGLVCVLLPTTYSYVKRSPDVFATLKDKYGWVSILIAMVISTLAGVVLERFVTKFEGMAVLAPLICGIGGNLAAIQTSRLSTAYHNKTTLHNNRKSALVLWLLTLPVSTCFLALIYFLHLGHTSISVFFMTGYMLAALTQVAILLICVDRLVKFLTNRKIDPDQAAIPLITAMGDAVGTCALTICFVVVFPTLFMLVFLLIKSLVQIPPLFWLLFPALLYMDNWHVVHVHAC